MDTINWSSLRVVCSVGADELREDRLMAVRLDIDDDMALRCSCKGKWWSCTWSGLL